MSIPNWKPLSDYNLDPPEDNAFYCPCCNKAPEERYYRDRDGEIVGCDQCISTVYLGEEEYEYYDD